MRSALIGSAAGVFLFLLSTAASADPPPGVGGLEEAAQSSGPLSVSTQMIESGGYLRSYDLYVPPPGDDPDEKFPLLFNLHGYTGSPTTVESLSGMSVVAKRERFVLVAPQGMNWNAVEAGWNAGSCCGWAMILDVDDVGFISDIIDAVSDEHQIDLKRVYVIGLSNGGMMGYRLACELSDRIAAVVSVAGGWFDTYPCNPSRPVPVLEFHGDADALVTYDEGTVLSSIPFVGATGSVAKMAELNGCKDKKKVTFSADDVVCERNRACKAHADVELCTVDNGGHSWPGGPLDLFQLDPVTYWWAGYQTESISATEKGWEFLRKHNL